MVEVAAQHRFPFADSEPLLQQYLDHLVKFQVHEGSKHLLNLRFETCGSRVAKFPKLRQQMLKAENAQKLLRIVTE